MSHDRGCFHCGRDPWDCDNCPLEDCVKLQLREQDKLLGVYELLYPRIPHKTAHRCEAIRHDRHLPRKKAAKGKRCSHSADYSVDGRVYCIFHAGLIALEKLIKGYAKLEPGKLIPVPAPRSHNFSTGAKCKIRKSLQSSPAASPTSASSGTRKVGRSSASEET